MKKFQFSLDKMLRYKDSVLEEQKNKLMQLRAEKNAVDESIEQAEESMRRLDDERTEKAAHGMTVIEMRSYAYNIDNTRRHLKALAVEQEKLARLVEKQLAVVVGCTQEVSGLEKLRDKQLDEYNQMVMKEEQLVVMELVSSKYIREQIPGEA